MPNSQLLFVSRNSRKWEQMLLLVKMVRDCDENVLISDEMMQ